MKRYFFDLNDGGSEPDAIGTELPDDDAAQWEAIRFAGEVLRGEPGRLAHGSMRVDVHDRDRSIRFAVKITLVRG